ncbi:hypothetical protein NDU88_003449 [Pleurodeles waltl]|uniref:Uncharacterized protein n=1 Tax=Pleurodeles waltl TaxID=8319 RepID=A0AAV7QC52_PLEWA|nr:hypothetical protein NDU88_003449 [Pleurodeles waltl]
MAELRSGVNDNQSRDDGAAALGRMAKTLEDLKDSLNEMIGGAGALSNNRNAREDTPLQAQRSLYRNEIRDSAVIPRNYEPAPRCAHCTAFSGSHDDISTQEQSNAAQTVLSLREHTTGYLPDSACDSMYTKPTRAHPHQDEQKIKKQRKTERERLSVLGTRG